MWEVDGMNRGEAWANREHALGRTSSSLGEQKDKGWVVSLVCDYEVCGGVVVTVTSLVNVGYWSMEA